MILAGSPEIVNTEEFVKAIGWGCTEYGRSTFHMSPLAILKIEVELILLKTVNVPSELHALILFHLFPNLI